MLSLIDILIFTKIAELKSVTRTARTLGMPKSSVSRDLARLEQDLGATLVQRVGKQLSLTDAGHVFHRHAMRVLNEVEEAQIAVGQTRSTPQGHLRVAAPVTSGQVLLAPLLPEFLARHPDITLSLELTSRRVDPIEEQIDVVIHVGPLEDSRLVARRLGAFPLCLYASPAYLTRHGMPRHPDDLTQHTVLDIFEGAHRWDLDGPDGKVAITVTPRLSINDPSAVKTAAVGGVGVGWMPPFLCTHDLASGTLVHVLPQWRRGEREMHALFPSPRTLSSRARAFIDFLVEKFASERQVATQ